MNILNGLTSSPRQKLTFTPDEDTAEECSMELWYSEGQAGWYFDLTYGDVVVTGRRLCCFPNVLRPWKGLLPFGLAVDTSHGLDPADVTSFTDGTATVYVLSSSELQTLESAVFTHE